MIPTRAAKEATASSSAFSNQSPHQPINGSKSKSGTNQSRSGQSLGADRCTRTDRRLRSRYLSVGEKKKNYKKKIAIVYFCNIRKPRKSQSRVKRQRQQDLWTFWRPSERNQKWSFEFSVRFDLWV